MDVIQHAPRRRRGFTIIEILIALALLGFLMIVVSPLLGDMLRFKQRMATEENLKVLVSAMETAVSADPLRHGYEAKDGAFTTGRYAAGNNVQYVIRDGQLTFDGWAVNFNDPTAPTQFRSILDLSGLSNAALLDGYGRPFLVRVSNVLSTSFDGVPLEYQVVALISNNGGEISPAGTPVLNSGTVFDPATGRLVLAGQDIGATFSTLPVYIRNLKKAKDQLSAIERAWYAYYKARQLADPDRTFARDYFAWKQNDINWDNQGSSPTGRVPLSDCGNTAGSMVNPDNAFYRDTFLSALGLARADVLNPFSSGFAFIHYDVCSAAVRSPDKGFSPPFSARIGFQLPTRNKGSDFVYVTLVSD